MRRDFFHIELVIFKEPHGKLLDAAKKSRPATLYKQLHRMQSSS
jgi:hypothetical protein